jgi:glycosyltransferase involved in cell wall biosynthesis
VRIVHLTAGTGTYYCGLCLRDHALAQALRRQGHQVTLVPLYLPPVLEGGGEADDGWCPIFFGGINVYLQQKSSLFRHTPGWLDRLLNARWLLSWSTRLSDMTRPEELGELTVSMLRGKGGLQRKELAKLTAFLLGQGPFDIISIGTGLIIGVAPELARALTAPVICTLQGEDAFLDSLPQPWRDQSWALIGEQARACAAVVGASRYYAAMMARRLQLAEGAITVIHNGIDLDGYHDAGAGPDTPTIGYLARLCALKGLGLLVDAFILLKRRPECARVRLRLAGSCTASDQRYVDEQQAKLAAAGIAGDVEVLTNLSRDEKLAFLRTLSVFSVPATYGEAFGLYVIEALASGVPVVQPRLGAFPELIEKTGGGLLCEAQDPASLAEGLATLVADRGRARTLGAQGRRAVIEHFSAEAMAGQFAGLCTRLKAG